MPHLHFFFNTYRHTTSVGSLFQYHPFSEEIFPNIQSKPPLAQLQAVPSCPIISYPGEETDPHLAMTSFQVVVERS